MKQVERGFAVAVRPDDALGFRLAGVRVEEVGAGAEGERLEALVEDPSVGLVAVEEELLGQVPPAILERAFKTGLPILFPFSLPRRYDVPGEVRSYLGALIRRAIGYHVRIDR